MAEITFKSIANRLDISETQLQEEFEKEFGIKLDIAKPVSAEVKQKLIQFIQLKQKSSVTFKQKEAITAGGKKKVQVEVKKSKTYVKKQISESKTKSAYKTDVPSAPPESLQKKVTVPKKSSKNKEVKETNKDSDSTPLNNKVLPPITDKQDQGKIKSKPVDESSKKALLDNESKNFNAPSKVKKKKKSALTSEDRINTQKYNKNYLKYADIIDDFDKKDENSKLNVGGTIQVATKHTFKVPTKKQVFTIEIGDQIGVSDLAKKIHLKNKVIIKILSQLGEPVEMDSILDFDTAQLVIEELGHKIIHSNEGSLENKVIQQLQRVGEQKARPPVITIMGHVDHGKTTLLDYIRKSSVADGEAGGITQHLSAYHVETKQGIITFVDTPGHAAFTAMRARGSKFTDIVVLIIAGDDGVMPQTIEIIQHVKASGVPMVIAVNKVDKPGVDIDKILQQLSQHEIITESWGGEIPIVEISAKSGKGIDNLLEVLLLQAEIMELQAYAKGDAEGVILEGRMEMGIGTVTSLIVQQGELKKGNIIVSGTQFGKVKAIVDSSNKRLNSVGPAIPVEVLGFSDLPNSGDSFLVTNNERTARELCEDRLEQIKVKISESSKVSLDDLFANQAKNDKKQINLIIKTDANGSSEALVEALKKLSSDQVNVNIVASGVGGIREADATLALAHQAIIIGFNVRADNVAKKLIQKEELDVRYYSIIYEVIDQIQQAIEGKLNPEFKEEVIGIAEVRDVFHAPKMGAIAGCMVTEGEIKRNCPIRVLREEVVIYEGELESLRRFKDDVSSVRSNTECGIGVKNYNDVKVGDLIEVFNRVEVKAKK